MRVLIAEDSPFERAALADAVRGLGHTCVEAVDGDQAWERYRADGADVVISDWLMPGCDGPELCRRVRASDNLSTYTYFILLTVLSDRAHAVQGMEAGADDYLAKPLNLNELELRLIAAARITGLHHALVEAKRREGRLEGVRLASRELAHLLNNTLSLPVGVVDLLRHETTLPAWYTPLVAEAAECLALAREQIRWFQRVSHVETKDTPAGPALDLARSITPSPDPPLY